MEEFHEDTFTCEACYAQRDSNQAQTMTEILQLLDSCNSCNYFHPG